MNRCRTPLADDASTLPAAAPKLDDDASQPASVELLTSWLSDVEEALRALSDATQHAADALIPPASNRRERVAAIRARRSVLAAPWRRRAALIRAAGGTPGDASPRRATLRAGAERCRRARDILASTTA